MYKFGSTGEKKKKHKIRSFPPFCHSKKIWMGLAVSCVVTDDQIPVISGAVLLFLMDYVLRFLLLCFYC